MNDKLKLDINGFGLINEASIELNKINVVGGVNSSGKSTASKLLYCFLKAMSINKKEYVLSAILPDINRFINIMDKPDPYARYELNIIYKESDDINNIISAYADAKDKFEKLHSYFEFPEYLFEIEAGIDKFIPFLLDKGEPKLSSIIRLVFKNESLLNFEGKSTFYNNSFKSSVIYEEFFPKFEDNRAERYVDLKEKGISYDDFDNKFVYISEGTFDSFREIFYIDSISYFDLNYFLTVDKNTKRIIEYKEHIEYLLKQLKYKNEDDLSDIIKEKSDYINNIISDIIQGHVRRKSKNIFSFHRDYHYIPKNSEKMYGVNISSGIQQISIIQILLDKYKLRPGSFLIIDEPELNLHPEWQFKFAEILVLLAKDLDVILFINSHSPLFIESIDAFTEFYDMENDINYYLTEESENKGKYNFIKINSNELYKVYDNLGNPYHLIDQLRLRKRLGE